MKRPKTLLITSILLGLSVLGGEVVARYVLGLGDPPLSVSHPTIEYMFKPNQDVLRFGNRFKTNSYGMRSGELSEVKNNNELRILVFGDSVLNGGNLTDQSELATEIIQSNPIRDKKVNVGNISAGSWGPGNWLAYAKEYGFFDADMLFLMVNSGDYADNPNFAPLNKNTHPTVKPSSALVEAIERYLPRYLPQFSNDELNLEATVQKLPVSSVERGVMDLMQFLELAKDNVRDVIVVQHLTRTELDNKNPEEGYYKVQEVCKKLSIPCISLEPEFNAAIKQGISPYRDNIHVNAEGQKLIAEVIVNKLVNP